MGDRLIIGIEKELSGFRLMIDLSIAAEIFVLFGPSGSGKTQILNALAGLMNPDRGEIRLDGRTLFRSLDDSVTINLPTRERRMAMVFQQYALFPHLTARENVAYPLRKDKSNADRLLQRMQLDHLAGRYPYELSGGQQQRVAIARALAADAKVLLLDEPFSALDRPIRDQLHRELIALQEETGLVIVYVTHSLDDAMTAGNRVAIINGGRIEQVSSLTEIFTHPRNRSVLEIIGVPNVINGTIKEDGLEWSGLGLMTKVQQKGRLGEVVTAYVPSEEITIEGIDGEVNGSLDDSHQNRFRGRVVRSQASGLVQRHWVELPNRQLIESARRDGRRYLNGEMVEVKIPADRIIFVEK